MPPFLPTLLALDAKATPGPLTVHAEHPTGIDVFDLGGFRIDADGQEQVAYIWNASQRCQSPNYVGPPHYFGSKHGEYDAALYVLLRNSAARLAAVVEAVAKAVQSVPPLFFDAANAPSGPDQSVAYAVDYSHLVNLRAALLALDEVKS
jgi:hypothetical protein